MAHISSIRNAFLEKLLIFLMVGHIQAFQALLLHFEASFQTMLSRGPLFRYFRAHRSQESTMV